MEIVVALASLTSLAALIGIIYPFKPFGTRRNALFALVGCFVLVGVLVPPSEETETAKSETVVAKVAEQVDETNATKIADNPWYSGGSLHDASVGDWSRSTYRNQLATAGDWATGVLGQSEVQRIGPDALRVKADQLVQCISKSTEGLTEIESMSAMEIGAACVVLLKWK